MVRQANENWSKTTLKQLGSLNSIPPWMSHTRRIVSVQPWPETEPTLPLAI